MTDPVRLVVFDCDGTLVDSQHMIIEAMRMAFDDHALPTPGDLAVRRVVGLSLPQAVAALLPAHPLDACLAIGESYKKAYMALRQTPAAQQEFLYDGAIEAIRALDEAGFIMGVATGKSRRGLDRVIERFGLARYFVTLQTADGHPSKPHPAMLQAAIDEAGGDPAATLVIGDTSYDMSMARAAGAIGVGVEWGYHLPSDLNDAGAAAILSHFSEVPQAVTRLLQRDGE